MRVILALAFPTVTRALQRAVGDSGKGKGDPRFIREELAFYTSSM